jgi:hypothetical protein
MISKGQIIVPNRLKLGKDNLFLWNSISTNTGEDSRIVDEIENCQLMLVIDRVKVDLDLPNESPNEGWEFALQVLTKNGIFQVPR